MNPLLQKLRDNCAQGDERMRTDLKPVAVNVTACGRTLNGLADALESAANDLREWAGGSGYAKSVRAELSEGGMRARGAGWSFTYHMTAGAEKRKKKK